MTIHDFISRDPHALVKVSPIYNADYFTGRFRLEFTIGQETVEFYLTRDQLLLIAANIVFRVSDSVPGASEILKR